MRQTNTQHASQTGRNALRLAPFTPDNKQHTIINLLNYSNMNNSEIGAAFVAMCNGTQTEKDIKGRNNLHVEVSATAIKLVSYYTTIAHFDKAANLVIICADFLSASTAKHQNTLCRRGLRFNMPVCRVRGVNWGDHDLTDYARTGDSRYKVKQRQELNKANRLYNKWFVFDTLLKYDVFGGSQDKAQQICSRYNYEQLPVYQ